VNDKSCCIAAVIIGYNIAMCLAIPSKIIKINEMVATVDVYGARRDVNLILLPEEVTVGDYVLVHAGFALQKVEKEYAEESLNLIKKTFEENKYESYL
jgi:hydrogenase expression/formation protein HypC